MQALISNARNAFHKRLLDAILTIDESGIPSNADKGNRLSVLLAQKIRDRIIGNVQRTECVTEQKANYAATKKKAAGQSSGSIFEREVMTFLAATFPKLQHIRPGAWHILQLGNQSQIKTSDFAQYEHLAYLTHLMKADAQLAAVLGNGYMVAPDVIIYRDLCTDEELNAPEDIVDEASAKAAALRKTNGGKPILHASVSAKWTMRSDRAQNSRTEALNLIRNRKGSLPHIVVVTGEPAPSRLASLAMGTGDIDCVYHFALYELMEAVREAGADDAGILLKTLTDGKRLKDISDLPLDLCI